MQKIRELDMVAYVRFASVYKNFRAVGDFEDFVGELDNPPSKIDDWIPLKSILRNK